MELLRYLALLTFIRKGREAQYTSVITIKNVIHLQYSVKEHSNLHVCVPGRLGIMKLLLDAGDEATPLVWM